MKKHLVLLAVLLQAASVSLVAQSKPKAGDIISGIVSDNDGPMIPILKDAAWELMDPDSWYFGYLQKNAPEGYVCGYVVHDYDDNDIYSLFLVNNKNKYELVRKTIDYSESRTIKKKLARQLKKVTDKHLDDAEKNREDDFKQASDDGMRVPGFYEGNVIYVMNPGQIATFKPGYSTYLPDRIWNDELRKFSFHL